MFCSTQKERVYEAIKRLSYELYMLSVWTEKSEHRGPIEVLLRRGYQIVEHLGKAISERKPMIVKVGRELGLYEAEVGCLCPEKLERVLIVAESLYDAAAILADEHNGPVISLKHIETYDKIAYRG